MNLSCNLYAETGLGKFFYMNSKVDASVFIMQTPNRKYNTLMAEPAKEELDSYFSFGGKDTRKILKLSEINFVDTHGFDTLLYLQRKYPEMELIVNEDVYELVRLLKLEDTLSISPDFPEDVSRELESMRKRLDLVEKEP
jgi:hypothetical protein